MIKIDIRENCIKCGKCVAVCPVSVLSQDQKDKTIFVKRVTNCIECGQCAAVCPVDCCVPDGNHQETEEELYAKKRFIHNEE